MDMIELLTYPVTTLGVVSVFALALGSLYVVWSILILMLCE